MPKISAVIITKNEEKNIERCLSSLQGVVDEILVYDSHSTDLTPEKAAEAGARVETGEWYGYAETKNKANVMAVHEWILSIDADEVLSDQLRENIIREKDKLDGAYSFSRLNNYCGKWIRHGGFYPDRKVRLFNRENATWEGNYVHEELKTAPNVEIQQLQGDLLHYTYESLADHVERANKYSTLAAERLVETGKVSMGKIFFNPWWRFVKTYFIQGGFRDGFYGYCICQITAFEVFLKYAKAVSISRKKK